MTADADFYLLEHLLAPAGQELQQVREHLEKTVQPVINQYWIREEFPQRSGYSTGRRSGSATPRSLTTP